MDRYIWFFAPFLGALIGYVTNSIAVKMLFHPHHQIKLGRFVVPFTPGMIPKRQKDFARAMGRMVEMNLLTIDDMEERLLSPEVKSSVVEGIYSKIFSKTDHNTIEDLALSISNPSAYEGLKKNLTSYLCDRIVLAAADIDIEDVIIKESTQAVRNNVGGLFSMMISDSTILSLAGGIGDKIKSYIAEHGCELFSPLLDEEIERMLHMNASDAVCSMGFSQERGKNLILKFYESAVHNNLKDLLSAIGIAKIVEEKIGAMEIQGLEDLILSIMKVELEAIINLGGVIGLAIGFFSLIF